MGNRQRTEEDGGEGGIACDGLNFGGAQGEGKTGKRGNRGGGRGIRRGGEIEEKVEEIVRGSLRDDGEG